MRALPPSLPDAQATPLRPALPTAPTSFTASLPVALHFHPGYAAAAAARGHSFRPVALSEFGGFAPSAMLALAGITHPGDELDADQEGERFFADGQSWATATHRAFTVHSLAASMCRAAYHAARSATSCRPISAPSR